MPARPLVRRRDKCGVNIDRRLAVPRPRRARDAPANVWYRPERDGRCTDSETDRRGLAHVVARHPGVGEAHGERESRDQDGGDYTRVLTAKSPAESD